LSKADFDIRKANPDDIAYIYATWLNSYRQDSAIGKSCRTSIFFENYRLVIDSILADKNTQVLIACHSEIPSVIYGYICFTKRSLHYAFTKEAFRELGIAKALVDKSDQQFKQHTHKTLMSEKINHGITHNPFVLYKQGEEHGETESSS
jgi:hypothetical protein